MSIRNVTALALLALVFACTTDPSAQEARTYFNGHSPADGDVAPFSSAVQVGSTLYLAGNIGLDPGQQVPATAEAEATNVLNNIQGSLEAAGMTMNDLIMVKVYSSDVSDYDAFNGVYRTYFTTEFPARAFIGVGTLLFGARFEVLGIAVKR